MMMTWDVFIVKLDGEHMTSCLLWTNVERERVVIALDEFTAGRLTDSHALGRQRTCRRQPITATSCQIHFLQAYDTIYDTIVCI